VVDGYLGMINCERQIAYALAPVENMPKPEKVCKTNVFSYKKHTISVLFKNPDIKTDVIASTTFTQYSSLMIRQKLSCD
jgi:hypothetical protein